MSSSGFKEYSSFRDPSGIVFTKDNVLYRQINPVYIKTYRKLMDSGLYDVLTKQRLLIPHKETQQNAIDGNKEALVIQPKRIPFISYPYEWCFSQYKQAAISTLRIHLIAMEHGMMLKDASAYNIQFINGHAVLIDTLSFEVYRENEPWVAYGQFCRHFLAPLLLMAHVDVRLSKMMLEYIDGIPLDLASKLLGRKGGFFAAQHIRMHAKANLRHGEDGKNITNKGANIRVSKNSFLALAQSLLNNVEKLKMKGVITEWGDYYSSTNYSDKGEKDKENIVGDFLKQIGTIKTAWDLGANDGRYSRLAINQGAHVAAFDIDALAVERNYNNVHKNHEAMLPLLLDLTNPSPALGFANRERITISHRQNPDVIIMLAVVHHLAISNNIPLSLIAEWLSSLSEHIIVEFVPKEDSQVQLLLATRDDIFDSYHIDGFEEAFGEYFEMIEKRQIKDSTRVLYLYRGKAGS